MTINNRFFFLLLFTLSGCGFGGGGTAGIDGTGGAGGTMIGGAEVQLISQGTISNRQADSITVNGRTFSTTDVPVFIDSDIATPSPFVSLDDGQIISIDASINTEINDSGSANNIIVTTQLLGPISALDASARTLTILGQNIEVTPDTIIGGAATSFNDLMVSDVVNVNGFKLSNGNFTATRIDKTNDTLLIITGAIENLSIPNSQFDINGLTIDFSSVKAALSSNGQIVQVIGTMLNSDSELIADEIRILTSEIEIIGTEVEIENIITSIIDANTFSIDGLLIETDADTEFINGDASEIALNVKIEVEGVVNMSGIILAKRVIF